MPNIKRNCSIFSPLTFSNWDTSNIT
ncbi:hypothetical protein HZP56_11505 [Elizabethkingia anophelis]|nr:hypothetical protein [Elizabethkingia anophelis]MCT3871669.1 hypothetical protein [Elizabethkingia anophelis]MCT4173599.1 hypothetical protein [Elizabethkingia anophelis]MCT4177081.1 hypothetical protein [Elizabethkingia anophelis]